jgi:predicted glycosyltransferase
MSEFDKWNELKKEIDKREKILKFRERDIWFLNIGKNIGYEQNGKGDEFLRPVVVLRKFSNRYFLGVPLSSKEKRGNYFFSFYHKGKLQTALLNQARVFDIKRAKYFKGEVGSYTFNKLKKAFINLLTPQNEGSGPLGQKTEYIISQNTQKNNGFDKWNELKKKINKKEKILKFKEREIFFINVGKNIGYEQNGKGDEFLRPVLIIKKFNKRFFLGILLTKQGKNNDYYFKLNESSFAILSQIRVFDAKRIKYFYKRLNENQFYELIEKIRNLLPTRESGLTSDLSRNIIPQKNKKDKFMWFDLVTPKSVLFFRPIIEKLKDKGKKVLITAREGSDYKEVVDLLNLYNLEFVNRGEFGGGDLKDKLKASINRQKELMEFVSEFNIEKLICLSSVDAVRVAFGLGIPVYNFYDIPLSDYKTNFKKALPQARLTIPLATKMFKPFVVPDEVILRFGLEKEQIIEYNFIDPLIWLKDFKFDKNYVEKIYKKYKIDRSKFTILVREEEYKASYVNKKYPFLYEALPIIYKKFNANIIIIPRYESEYLKKEFPFAYVIEEKIILQHLLKDVDLFIGGGGTINTEACFLGTPTISTRSFISHYDKWQIDNNLMVWTNNLDELINYVKLVKEKKLKPDISKLNRMNIDIDLILEEII